MAKVKCPICNQSLERSESVQVGHRYCCPEHAEEFREKQAKVKQKMPEQRPPTGYPELVAAICDAYNIDAPTGQIIKQIQNFKNNLNYTYDGMRATLIYCLNWADSTFEFEPERGVSFIPYMYEEAKRFYMELGAVKNHLASVDAEQAFMKERIVEISEHDLEEARYPAPKLIDISSIQ